MTSWKCTWIRARTASGASCAYTGSRTSSRCAWPLRAAMVDGPFAARRAQRPPRAQADQPRGDLSGSAAVRGLVQRRVQRRAVKAGVVDQLTMLLEQLEEERPRVVPSRVGDRVARHHPNALSVSALRTPSHTASILRPPCVPGVAAATPS